MKTFKLVSLEVLEKKGERLDQQPINLIDGLIINREDDSNRWLIEAYVEQVYFEKFNEYKEEEKELVLHAKITKTTNPPATFVMKIVNINEIGSDINVLLMGTLVDRQRDKVEKELKQLIDEGYKGEDLLIKFKKRNTETQSS